jgi:hypothetical protein
LDLGGGWGVLGIACVNMFQAQVTGLDADAAVFPSLQLHAQRHGVHLATRQGTVADLAPQDLAAFELIVRADICLWEERMDPFDQLVCHGVVAGVADIRLTDPGRPPFDDLCARCLQHGDAAVLAWATTTPVRASGRMPQVVGAAGAPRAACRVGSRRGTWGGHGHAPSYAVGGQRHAGGHQRAGGLLTSRSASTP